MDFPGAEEEEAAGKGWCSARRLELEPGKGFNTMNSPGPHPIPTGFESPSMLPSKTVCVSFNLPPPRPARLSASSPAARACSFLPSRPSKQPLPPFAHRGVSFSCASGHAGQTPCTICTPSFSLNTRHSRFLPSLVGNSASCPPASGAACLQHLAQNGLARKRRYRNPESDRRPRLYD